MSAEEKMTGDSFGDLIVMRGKVTHSFTSVEMGMCEYISSHYFGGSNNDFIHTVLYESSVSFFDRLNIFKKILEARGFTESSFPFGKLRRLGHIRNIFAHAWVSSPDSSQGKFYLIGEAGMKDTHDAAALYEEFFTHFEEVVMKVIKMSQATSKP